MNPKFGSELNLPIGSEPFSFSAVAFSSDALHAALADPSCGGYASFEGWVRDHNEGRPVLRLEYEAYEALAVTEGRRILAEALARFGVRRAACVHRLGTLAIGELAVWVGVSAAHRDEAFAACRYVIDEVKHRLPIWKQEHYVDGTSGWVNCERCAAAEPLELEFETLAAAHGAGLELVDIREAWERDADPPGPRIARHLPFTEFMDGRSQLPGGPRYLIVCAHGVRSLALTEELRARGYAAVYSMRGGLAGLRA